MWFVVLLLCGGRASGFVSSVPRSLSGSRAPCETKTVMFGIPKMFRWLTDQYPSIMERISEGLPEDGADGSHVDNLYLDMNGIIHQCTHGDAGDEGYALTTKEQFLRIFQLTDKVCKVVKPRKVIYLAVDGIAPRAKMNQQRSRRFRSSREREDAEKDKKAEAAVYASYKYDPVKKQRSETGPSIVKEVEVFDSNCITPGTDFMHKLTIAFKAWFEFKCKEDPFYQGPLIVFSGADVPGEGEHKVMDFVRSQRDTWDPELRHCFYGLDADLIMLSLVTHQKHFRLLREKMVVRHGNKKKTKDPLALTRQDFEILEIGLLREMIELQFEGLESTASSSLIDSIKDPSLKKEMLTQRFVDDFVFTCMLVGNDFLPQLPHLDILDGSLDLSILTYRETAPLTKGFLTDKEKIHLSRFEVVARALAAHEAKYFARRGSIEAVPQYEDENAYRKHYYSTKFGFKSDDDDFESKVRTVVQEYVLGLFWCAQYYHRGAEAWDWFYPYLYAPLASDLVDLADLEFSFPSSDSRPFTPLMQLLSVLPPQSKALLPAAYADAMDHPLLKDAYPSTFDVDPNGKAQPWEAITLIPFLDEDKMIGVLSQIDHLDSLSNQERQRNDIQHAKPWYSREPTPQDFTSDFTPSSQKKETTAATGKVPASSNKPRRR